MPSKLFTDWLEVVSSTGVPLYKERTTGRPAGRTGEAACRSLADRAKREKRDNVVALAGTAADPRLPEKADLILMVDVFHHIENRERYLRNLAHYLKAGGRIAVIDFRLESLDGPPKAARIASEAVIAELKGAGYKLAAQHDFLPNQYFLVFEVEGSRS